MVITSNKIYLHKIIFEESWWKSVLLKEKFRLDQLGLNLTPRKSLLYHIQYFFLSVLAGSLMFCFGNKTICTKPVRQITYLVKASGMVLG